MSAQEAPRSRPREALHVVPEPSGDLVPITVLNTGYEGANYYSDLAHKGWAVPGRREEASVRAREQREELIADLIPVVDPLALRGFLPADVMFITRDAFKYTQVKSRITEIRERTKQPPNSKKEVARLAAKGRAIAYAKRVGKPIEPDYDLLFVQALNDAQLLTGDLSYKEELERIYKEEGEELPDSASERARYEVLLRGLQERDAGNDALLLSYVEMGKGVNEDWFASSLLNDHALLKEKSGGAVSAPTVKETHEKVEKKVVVSPPIQETVVDFSERAARSRARRERRKLELEQKDLIQAEQNDLLLPLRNKVGEVDMEENLRRLESPLRGVINRMGLSPEDREDTFQIVAERIIRKIDTYSHKRGSFKTWAVRIAAHAAIDKQRSLRIKRYVPLDMDTAFFNRLSSGYNLEHSVIDNERDQEVSQAIKKLSTKNREVIELYYFKGLSCNETSKEIDVPVPTVKTRLFQARTKLRTILEEQMAGD